MIIRQAPWFAKAQVSWWPPQNNLDCFGKAWSVNICYNDCAVMNRVLTGRDIHWTVLYNNNILCVPMSPTGQVLDGPSCLYQKNELLRFCRFRDYWAVKAPSQAVRNRR